jgi:putative PIN family toxin of toxin-antitoxin system
MIRAVLDANVLVSAAIRPGGKPDQIVRKARGGFTWLTSDFIVSEVAAVLSRPHIQAKYLGRVTREERAEFLGTVRTAATTVEVTSVVTTVKEDPNDNPVLACGIDGQADYVVTGDQHLLALVTCEEIMIVTPAQFLLVLAAQG